MKIYHQSVFDRWPMEDGSMQAIICSPPYWGLRKYDIPDIIIGGDMGCEHDWNENSYIRNNDKTAGEKQKTNKGSIGRNTPIFNGTCKCGAWRGQYGLEPSYKDYIEHTVLWAREAWRVLRDDGVMFLNIGDTYATHTGKRSGQFNTDVSAGNNNIFTENRPRQAMPEKCKMLIPHRVAIALIDDGWRLRNDLIWHKPNAMPESCQDRFSKKFEYIFMFVKSEKYYFDLDAIRGNYNPNTLQKYKYQYQDRTGKDLGQLKGKDNTYKSIKANELGKNPGDIWQINTQPSSEKHFAMWPEKLVERMLLCSTRPGDSILDCFAGSGTTLRVAEQHNRVGFGIDLGYQDIQRKRLDNIQKKLL